MSGYHYDVGCRTVFVSLHGQRLGEVSPGLSFDTALRDHCVGLGSRCEATWAVIQATAQEAHRQGPRWCGPDNRLARWALGGHSPATPRSHGRAGRRVRPPEH